MSNPSPTEIISAFRSFLQERADAGVAAAKAVSAVTCSGRTVTVEFDHDVAGFERSALLESLPFENWADFVGQPIVFDTPKSGRLRSGIDRVTTRLRDGRELGSRSAAELFEAGTGRRPQNGTEHGD